MTDLYQELIMHQFEMVENGAPVEIVTSTAYIWLMVV